MAETKGSVIALGTFDGLHKGHRAVLGAALGLSDLRPVAVTFDEPPKRKLGDVTVGMLMDPQSKLAKLREMGFEDIKVLSYDEVCDLTAEEYLDWLFREYDVKAAVCGFNHRFGKGAEGNAEFLTSYCHSKGAEAVICPPLSISGQEVSSSLIRELIADGNISFANMLLGEPFSFKTPVEHGDERGRTLGFPTVNQQLDERLAVPKFGVYATAVSFDGKCYAGVTNIGIRPTYLLKKPQSETYIVDFSGDLYGKEVEIKLLSFLREEMQFGSAEELKSAIAADKEKAIGEFKVHMDQI